MCVKIIIQTLNLCGNDYSHLGVGNVHLFIKQPAKISKDCDWSRNWTNSDEVKYVRKRKEEELTSIKTKKLRICDPNIL